MIKLTDKMPPMGEGKRVLVYVKQTGQFHGVNADELNDAFYDNPDDMSEICRNATHWMEIPQVSPESENILVCHCCGKEARWCGDNSDHIHCDHCGMHYSLESTEAMKAETITQARELMLKAYNNEY